ncbi:hypothetical protein D1832_11810, partial [Dermacoccus abyssi]
MLPAKASWEVRGEALRLLMLGHSARQVARMMGVSSMAISRWAKTAGVTLNMGARGGVTQLVYEQHRDDEWLDSAGRLTRSGRVILHVRRREGRSNGACQMVCVSRTERNGKNHDHDRREEPRRALGPG